MLKERNVADESIDAFFDRIASILWPRFKFLMNAQIKALREANGKKLGLSTAAIELHSHYVARRYAEFTSSIVLIIEHNKSVWKESIRPYNTKSSSPRRFSLPLSPKSKTPSHSEILTPPAKGISRSVSGSDMIGGHLTSLQVETIDLLKRITKEYSDKKRMIVFLINNLDQILSLFEERRVFSNKEICTPFEEMLSQQRDLFVEEELMENYSKLITFVRETETKMQSSGGSIDLNVVVVESLGKDFAITWKKGIEQANKNVLSYFSNFRNGLEILKQVLTQLLLYYTRFQDIIRKCFRGKAPDFCKDFVNTASILAEIKKYALSI